VKIGFGDHSVLIFVNRKCFTAGDRKFTEGLSDNEEKASGDYELLNFTKVRLWQL